MKRYQVTLTVLLAAILITGMSGCVAQREADDLRTLYRKSQEQVIELQTQLEECYARNAALQEEADKPDPAMLLRLEQALEERDHLKQALADAEAQLRNAERSPILPPELDSALEELAQINPSLMSYDAGRGMVKFRSDLTFASGSAEVNQQAGDSMSKLATVLKSKAALPYEIRIVGHTDNVPIKYSKAKHPTNWHLSVHRAIAVKDVLEKSGVPAVRMGVAGYGEYRPLTPNGPSGAEANRRVEIFLVATGTDSGSAESDTKPLPKAVTLPEPPIKGVDEEDPAHFK